jgi:hypothetical protein
MPTQTSAGSVTILRCIGGNNRATKTWLFAGAEQPIKTDFNAGKWFTAERRHLANVAELSNLLTVLERDPVAFVIRGEPLPDINLSQPVRRKKIQTRLGIAGFATCPAAFAGYCSTLIRSRGLQPLM